MMSVCPSVCLSVCPSGYPSVSLSLKISVTTEPIVFYPSGNIPTGPVVGCRLFSWAGGIPTTPQKTKNPPAIFFLLYGVGDLQVIKDVIIPLGAKPLEARGEATSLYNKVKGSLSVRVSLSLSLYRRISQTANPI